MANVTTSDVLRVYEDRAIDLTTAEASALADEVNTLADRSAALAALADKADASRERWEELCDMNHGNSWDYDAA